MLLECLKPFKKSNLLCKLLNFKFIGEKYDLKVIFYFNQVNRSRGRLVQVHLKWQISQKLAFQARGQEQTCPSGQARGQEQTCPSSQARGQEQTCPSSQACGQEQTCPSGQAREQEQTCPSAWWAGRRCPLAGGQFVEYLYQM